MTTSQANFPPGLPHSKKTHQNKHPRSNRTVHPLSGYLAAVCPPEKDKTDFVIEKATELGCRKILPVITRHTNSGNVKTERYVAQSIEAAEQCRRTDLPEIVPAQKLEDVLSGWDSQRTLFFMDETRNCQDFFPS